jgi:GTPase SAR1 family protein
MADQWYKFGHGFLLIYSITDRPTFDAIYGFHQDILRVKDRQYVPCVVASNKVGLFSVALLYKRSRPRADTQCDLARLRQVGQFEGRDMAKSLSAPFIECSASDGVNIDVAFRELVKLVRKDERVSPFWSSERVKKNTDGR